MDLDKKEKLLIQTLFQAGASPISSLKEKLVAAGEMSRATLYLKLKGLKKKGYIKRRLIEDELCWDLTPEGIYEAAGTEVIAPSTKLRFAEAELLRVVEKPEMAMWDETAVIERIGVKSFSERYGFSEEEYVKRLRSYIKETTPVFWRAWCDMIYPVVAYAHRLMMECQLIRAVHPFTLNEEEMKIISSHAIESAIMSVANLMVTQVKKTFQTLIKKGIAVEPVFPPTETIKKFQEKRKEEQKPLSLAEEIKMGREWSRARDKFFKLMLNEAWLRASR